MHSPAFSQLLLTSHTAHKHACAGNARWAPPVSEYREARGGYALHPAARPLLTVEPPAGAPALAATTTQALATGRLAADEEGAASGALSLERPATAERGQGRAPLTVLQQRPGMLASTGIASSSGGGEDAASAAGSARSARVTGGTAAISAGAGARVGGAGRVSISEPPAQQQAEQQQEGPVSLKVRRRPAPCTAPRATTEGLALTARPARRPPTPHTNAPPCAPARRADRAVAAAPAHAGRVRRPRVHDGQHRRAPRAHAVRARGGVQGQRGAVQGVHAAQWPARLHVLLGCAARGPAHRTCMRAGRTRGLLPRVRTMPCECARQ